MKILLLTFVFLNTLLAYDYTDIIQVTETSSMTQIVGEIQNLKGEWKKVFFPFTKLIHKSGEVIYADHKGEVQLDFPADQYQVSLSSRYFTMELKDKEPRAQVNGEGEISLNKLFAIADITARANLDIARLFTLKHMVPGARTDWFYKSVPVILDFDEGCNAAWNGQQILLFTGDATCIASGLSADIVIHEYGHGVLANISDKKHFPMDFGEAFADSFMAMVTRDSLVAEGFYPSRAISYLRDLEHNFTWPVDWRGVYTGSLVFSSVFWDVISLLQKSIGSEAFKVGVQVLYGLPVYNYLINSFDIGDALKAYHSLLTQMPEVYSNSDLICSIEGVFMSRGIELSSSVCPHKGPLTSGAWAIRQELEVRAGDIPDMAQLTQEFSLNLSGIQRVRVQLEIEHFFADDLMIYFELEDGRVVPVFRGLEEILIPKVIEVRNFPENYSGKLKLVINDHGVNYSGTLYSGKITFF